ncbi:MAG TPA: class I adenylate-forming enzyme family protein [Solirubrobacter sp.]|nr:class I adenylate-forming enzyme family protein [Solirubrobacter sp.]
MGASQIPRPARLQDVRTIADVLEHAAAAVPDTRALVVDDRSVTFAELRSRALALAAGLRARGLRPGDHVACWFPNSIEFAECFYAAAYLRLVLVPLNTWYGARDFDYALRQSDSRALLAVGSFNGRSYAADIRAALAANEYPALELTAIAGGTADAVDYEALIAQGGEAVGERPAPGDAALMLYTSGTTAFPKGVMNTHDGLTGNAILLAERMGIPTGSRYYCPAPFFHAGGAVFCLLAGHASLSTVVANGRFTPEAAVEQMRRHRCNVVGGFDTMYVRMLDAFTPEDAGHLEVGWWATGPAALFRRVERRLGLRLVNLYGLTEASGNVTSTPPDWPLERRASGQGIPLPGRAVRIVDQESGRPLPANEIGEIRVGGWGVMTEYYRKPDETRRAIDDEGWLCTGDLGSIDDDGDLHFAGRGRDKLKVGGENVAPAEIEHVLYEHPAVEEVAVIGIRDDVYGEVPVAFVKPVPGREIGEEELRAFAKRQIAGFKVPRTIVFVEDFPRSSTGKIRKDALAATAS